MPMNPQKRNSESFEKVKRERRTPVIYPLQHHFTFICFFSSCSLPSCIFILMWLCLHVYVCVCVCADDQLVTILRHHNFLKEMREIAVQGESQIAQLVHTWMEVSMTEGLNESFSFKVVGGELTRLHRRWQLFRLQTMSPVSRSASCIA